MSRGPKCQRSRIQNSAAQIARTRKKFCRKIAGTSFCARLLLVAELEEEKTHPRPGPEREANSNCFRRVPIHKSAIFYCPSADGLSLSLLVLLFPKRPFAQDQIMLLFLHYWRFSRLGIHRICAKVTP
jgi:hypothetical protein